RRAGRDGIRTPNGVGGSSISTAACPSGPSRLWYRLPASHDGSGTSFLRRTVRLPILRHVAEREVHGAVVAMYLCWNGPASYLCWNGPAQRFASLPTRCSSERGADDGRPVGASPWDRGRGRDRTRLDDRCRDLRRD